MTKAKMTYESHIRNKSDNQEMVVSYSAREIETLSMKVAEYGDDTVAEVIDLAARDGNYGGWSTFSIPFLLCDSVFQKLMMLRGSQRGVKAGWEVPEHMKPDIAEWKRSYHGRYKEVASI